MPVIIYEATRNLFVYLYESQSDFGFNFMIVVRILKEICRKRKIVPICFSGIFPLIQGKVESLVYDDVG